MKNKLHTILAMHLGLAAVVAQPVITNQPQNQMAIAGTTAIFTLGATGAQPLNYQWRSHANQSSYTNIPFGTEATLVLTNVQPTARRFAVVVTDAGGLSVTSSPLVSLTVVAPPTITPANPTASLFADMTLLATNIAAGAVSYQWLLNGAPITGAVTTKLMLTNILKTNVGAYAIVATYAFGSATSQVATLKIVPFNSMYCFGFSWTDTHNCAASWPPPSFYQGRACNGPMWPEFLSTNLGMSYVESNNYAFCGALSSDELNQVTIRLRVPSKPELSLYCLWEGGSDFNNPADPTNAVAWNQIIQTALRNNSNTVHRLYERGARAILFQTQFGTNDLDVALFGVYRAGLIEAFLRDFNSRFVTAMDSFSRTHPDVRLYFVDLFLLWNEISTHPDVFGFTQIVRNALDDPGLTDKSFTGPGADYLMWNASHPTSKFHKLLAARHLEALTNAVLERLEAKLANSSATVAMNHLLIGRDYTLQKSSDLASWNDVQSFTASAGTNQVSQALDTGTSSVFYRLQWQP